MAKAEMAVMDKKYQAENDARTMMQAMEISKDPDRMKACMGEMKKQKMAMDGAMSMLGGMGKGDKIRSMMKE